MKNRVQVKIIPFHEDYAVSETGYIFRIIEPNNWNRNKDKKLKQLHPSNNHGYDVVQLDGQTLYVHRLVGEAFVNKTRLDRTIVFHIDGNRHNNCADNLIWVTKQEEVYYSNVSSRERVVTMRQNLELQ